MVLASVAEVYLVAAKTGLPLVRGPQSEGRGLRIGLIVSGLARSLPTSSSRPSLQKHNSRPIFLQKGIDLFLMGSQ